MFSSAQADGSLHPDAAVGSQVARGMRWTVRRMPGSVLSAFIGVGGGHGALGTPWCGISRLKIPTRGHPGLPAAGSVGFGAVLSPGPGRDPLPPGTLGHSIAQPAPPPRHSSRVKKHDIKKCSCSRSSLVSL